MEVQRERPQRDVSMKLQCRWRLSPGSSPFQELAERSSCSQTLAPILAPPSRAEGMLPTQKSSPSLLLFLPFKIRRELGNQATGSDLETGGRAVSGASWGGPRVGQSHASSHRARPGTAQARRCRHIKGAKKRQLQLNTGCGRVTAASFQGSGFPALLRAPLRLQGGRGAVENARPGLRATLTSS